MTDDEKSPPAQPAPSPKDEKPAPSPDLTELTRQGMEKMQSALSNYFSSLAGAAQGEAESGSEATSAFAKYAGRNVANAVAFAQKLVQAKDVQDLVKVQTDFFKSQMEAVAEQAASVRETAEKASAERLDRIAALAEQVFGTRVRARRWLRRPRRTLQGQTALSCIESESGAQIVEEMLRRMQERSANAPSASVRDTTRNATWRAEVASEVDWSVATNVVLVRHCSAAWRLYREEFEPAFLNTGAFDTQHVSVGQREPGTNVRMQCSHGAFCQLSVCGVDGAICRHDALGVSDAFVCLRHWLG